MHLWKKIGVVGVALALMEQTRKLYCCAGRSPVTAFDVPLMAASLICVPEAQLAGAVAPVW